MNGLWIDQGIISTILQSLMLNKNLCEEKQQTEISASIVVV